MSVRGEPDRRDRRAGRPRCPPRRRSPDARRRTRCRPTGPLVDTFGRVHTDLRLSFTDDCNFRCVYCMPEEGVPLRPRAEILTFEEIVRVAGGGPDARGPGGPTHRRRAARCAGGSSISSRRLAEVGFEDLALTTNGTGLVRHLAGPLADAGLQRVNVSCDSLRPDRFAADPPAGPPGRGAGRPWTPPSGPDWRRSR